MLENHNRIKKFKLYQYPAIVNIAVYYWKCSCTFLCDININNIRIIQGKKLNRLIKSLFLISLHTKYSRSFITLQLNHWCHMDYFNNVLTTFLGLEYFSSTAVYRGLRKLSNFIKITYMCPEDEHMSYGFGTTWGWVIKNLNFSVNYPFK